MKSAATPATTPRLKIPRPVPPFEPFPLTWHSRGYWMKKRHGRELRFTRDAQESYDQWRDVLDREKRGERATSRKRYTLKDAVNLYLTRQKTRFDEGDLSPAQFTKCRFELQEQLPAAVAISVPLSDFNAESPDDPRPGRLFGKIRAKAIARGLQAAHRHIVLVRAALNYAARKHLMRAPDYGDDFDPPTQSRIDRARNELDEIHGERSWSIEELQTILQAAAALAEPRETAKGVKPPRNPHLYAQILLGLFAAFGSDDCSALPESKLRRKEMVHAFPRAKNGRPRCAYLPQRVWDAIDVSLAYRTGPATDDAAHLVFRTANGTRSNAAGQETDALGLKRIGRNDTIGKNFQRLVERAGLSKHRAGFKTLRAMCRTMLVGAGLSDDIIAVIMGRRFRHPVDEYYLRGELRAELVKAADHIERQLFPITEQTQSPRPKPRGEKHGPASAGLARSKRKARPAGRSSTAGSRTRG